MISPRNIISEFAPNFLQADHLLNLNEKMKDTRGKVSVKQTCQEFGEKWIECTPTSQTV
jgi:hypothetical protein